MHPVCFQAGEFRVHWFGVMMALGFMAGLLNWTLLGRGRGRDFNSCSDLLFWVMVSGVIGARAAYVISDFGSYAQRPLSMLRVDQGGLIFYGGFVGALAALLVLARVRRENPLALLDFAATSLPLAHAFGRIGCLLNGCCHGRVWDGAWAVRYGRSSLVWVEQHERGLISADADATLAVHPVQVYEALFNLALYGLLLALYRRRPRNGAVAAAYAIAYSAGRFALETFRGDARTRWGALSVAQVLSLIFAAAGVAALAALLRRPRPAATP